MNGLIILIGIITLVFPIAVAIIRYIDGDFTYKDTIIEKNKCTRTATNSFVAGGTSEQVYRILIERKYDSGRIKFITKEIAI